MTIWIHTLAAVLSVALAGLVGAVFLGKRKALDAVLMYLVSLSAGVLVGGAMIHLLPHAIEHATSPLEAPLYFLGGFVGFFFLERFLWGLHHDHSSFPLPQQVGETHQPHDRHGACLDHDHGSHSPMVHAAEGGPQERPIVRMALVGGSLHNLLDGAVIAAAFSTDLRLGWITTAAVLLHEIPREFGDFGILVHAGMSPRRALFFNGVTGLTSIVGAVAVLALGPTIEGLSNALVAITAGTFVYISAAHLIPEIHHHHPKGESIGHGLVLLFGVALMVGFAFLEPMLG